MKRDVVLAGVGGQGVTSAAVLLAEAGARAGLTVKQGEIHGMAQRGGAVTATVRLATGTIHSDLVSPGGADLLIALDPIEALRHLGVLAPEGRLVAVVDTPVDPAHGRAAAAARTELASITGVEPVAGAALAREAGSPRAVNIVALGAAAGHLPVPAPLLEAVIVERFPDAAAAFRAGRAAAQRTGTTRATSPSQVAT